jgi:hypothetical protein
MLVAASSQQEGSLSHASISNLFEFRFRSSTGKNAPEHAELGATRLKEVEQRSDGVIRGIVVVAVGTHPHVLRYNPHSLNNNYNIIKIKYRTMST